MTFAGGLWMFLQRLAFSSIIFSFVWTTTAAHAGAGPNDKAEPKDRMHRAELATSLDREGLLPWHLKLEVQLFDGKGQPAETGTIEEWWASPKMRLISYAMPSYTGQYLENVNGHFRTGKLGSPPLELELLLDQAVHPMPSAQSVDESQPELKKQNFGKVELECVMLSRPLKRAGDSTVFLDNPPLGLFPSYCFNPGQDVLRAFYNVGSEQVLRNAIGTFQKTSVAVDVSVVNGRNKLASGHIAVLTGMKVDPAQFEQTDELVAPREALHIAGGVAAGSILNKVQPVFPQSAKEHHSSGAVILHAVIGRDGHIHALTLISAPDSDLAISALDAVRQWTYKPYLLNGDPVDVDTTITVNYNFGN